MNDNFDKYGAVALILLVTIMFMMYAGRIFESLFDVINQIMQAAQG